MTFSYPGYNLKFIQTKQCQDGSGHLKSFIYKFFSPITKLNYIVIADHHKGDVFGVKFYCKKDKTSQHKYSKLVNKGDRGNVLMSCANVIPLLLAEFPSASFTIMASRSVDKHNKWTEPVGNNQRYRLYEYIVPLKFGTATFEHVKNPANSTYMLFNRKSSVTKDWIKIMLQATYPDLVI